MSRRVLIIEEDEGVRRVAECAALALAADVEVILAADQTAAQTAIARAPFDAVLVDAGVAAATTLLSALQREDARAPVFLLGRGGEAHRLGADFPQVVDTIPKSALDAERLAGALRSAWRIRDAESRAAALHREEERNRGQLGRLVVASLAITSAESYALLAEASVRAVASIFDVRRSRMLRYYGTVSRGG